MVDTVNFCKSNCIGCGLCHSELGTSMKKGRKGFLSPSLENNTKTEVFLNQVCPILGYNATKCDVRDVWGKYIKSYAGYAKNEYIRKKASSGGILTALSIYLLERGKVDGIIHVVMDEENPIATMDSISSTREQILAGCGSRYGISSPWMKLNECVDKNKKYAAIGKPCDIEALRNMKNSSTSYDNIIYLLSFFCAGLPSDDANGKLLHNMGCEQNECKMLVYRGNGWPGTTTAIDKSGKIYEMQYSKAWGGILGRDVHPFCRICFDGIGDAADIACGDGWYIMSDKTVDFSERDGRNVVFARTELGCKLLEEALDDDAIALSEWEDISQLRVIQKYQYTRRTTMRAKLLAYRIMGQKVPLYSKNLLKDFSKRASKEEKLRIFLGTIKRFMNGSIYN